ncbi:hypothetical protein ONR57_20470 [Hoyosella sp. YIM 151337]|uniref:hypothetical protein n=1 Tax=Hoyosella sp. YIM 151337 TaxID=2992742 RepID=UPI00223593BA|nr:hypothetical protein [Hoyosella sp. YIM 151337]MCW4355685.1 hypothetical protein [Hoyosella sp. YIM 151337]
MTSTRTLRRKTLAGAALAALTITATACVADGGTAGSADRTGVVAGASKDEYIAAFEDIPPIHLTTQLPTSPGDAQALHIETYAEALNEWSGGKITMEVAYGNSIAPPDQAPQALADGRLDFDYVYAVYEPSRYPAHGALANASFLGDHTPVAGTLEALGGYLEAALATPEIMAETEREGVKLLLPWGAATSSGLMCTQPRASLAELSGAQVRVGGAAFARQAEALGMSPVSLPYSEIYQALQRGTIDCELQALWTRYIVGTVPLAPNYTIDSDVGFARLFYGLGFGKAKWDSLPLVAQQLIYDRLDVYIEVMLREGIWNTTIGAAELIDENGGTYSSFSPDVAAALTEVNAQMLGEARRSPVLDGDALVSSLEDALQRWRGVVAELGYPGVSDAEFLDWYTSSEIDLEPFMDRLREDVLSQHRPS